MTKLILSFDILLNLTINDLSQPGGLFKKSVPPSPAKIQNLVQNSIEQLSSHFTSRGASKLAQIQYIYYGGVNTWDEPIGSRNGFASWPIAIMGGGGAQFDSQKVLKVSDDSEFEDDEMLNQIKLACSQDKQYLEYWNVGSSVIIDSNESDAENGTKDLIVQLRGDRFGDVCVLELPGDGNIFPTIAPRDIDLTASRYTGDTSKFNYNDLDVNLLLSEYEVACRIPANDLIIVDNMGNSGIDSQMMKLSALCETINDKLFDKSIQEIRKVFTGTSYYNTARMLSQDAEGFEEESTDLEVGIAIWPDEPSAVGLIINVRTDLSDYTIDEGIAEELADSSSILLDEGIDNIEPDVKSDFENVYYGVRVLVNDQIAY